MIGYQDVAITATFVLGYALIAGRVERTALSGPIIFAGVGLLLGPYALDLVALEVGSGELRTLAELTLAIVLFTDAASTDLAGLRRNVGLPLRLLAVGLPLTLLLGMIGAALLLHGPTWLELALIATMLAPTDAALGAPVVADEAVPEPCREALNVESGLNDGICVPIFLGLLGLAAVESEGASLATWLAIAAEEVGIGAALGVLVGAGGGWLLGAATRTGTTTPPWADNAVLALAGIAFAAPQWLGGSGFIGAFVAGLAMRRVQGARIRPRLRIGLVAGDLLSLVTWMLFGGAVLGLMLTQLDWRTAAYGLVSLTVVRMLPVALALAGSGLRWDTVLFLGWFGPRGLATIVFAAMAYRAAGLDGAAEIIRVAAWTVVLSVVLHGVSATPLARWYGKRCAARGGAI